MVMISALMTDAYKEFWQAFSKNKGAVAGLMFMLLVIFCALFAPWVAPHNPSEQYRDFLLTPPAWLDQLEPAARSSMRNAFVLLYKLADVDLVGQQIRALLGSPRDGFDFTPDGLIVWPAENTGPLHVHLRPRRDSDELPEPTSKHTVVVWDPTAALFSQRKLSREDCNRSWPDGATNAPAKLLSDVAVLPSET